MLLKDRRKDNSSIFDLKILFISVDVIFKYPTKPKKLRQCIKMRAENLKFNADNSNKQLVQEI